MKTGHTDGASRSPNAAITDIRDVFSENSLLLMRDALVKVTGLSLTVLGGDGRPLAEPASMPPICRSLGRDAAFEGACASAGRYGLDMAFSHKGQFIFFCPCGLIRAVVPVISSNRCVGGFCIGQVRSANAPGTTPGLKRLLKPENEAVLRKQHIRDLLEAAPVYDFSYFTYIVAIAASVINEAVAKETAQANLRVENAATLAMLRAKTAMLEQELAVRESALTQWRTQMNLDFFINALSSLSGLAATENSPKTQEICLLLADHLRHRMHDRTGFIPLREELRAVGSFLAIQNARYGDMLNYDLVLPDELTECPFPAQTLLPFVEAALLRGLPLKQDGYAFSLSVTREKNEITLLLQDNAPGEVPFGGADLAAYPGGGEAASALAAAVLRLETLLGPHHEVRVSADAQGSTSYIRYTPPGSEGA